MLNKIIRVLGLRKKTDQSNTSTSVGISDSQPNNQERDLALEAFLLQVAQEFEDEIEFKSAAKRVAYQLEFEKAIELLRYFHDNPPEPESLKSKTAKYGMFGVWMSICQDSVFEILYNYKEKAIPTLYSIGFGDYDWTQYKAIDILCRFAGEGIQTNEIVKDIGDKINHFRYEAVFPSIESLSLISDNPEIPKIILNLFEKYSNDDLIDGLHILRILLKNYPDNVKSKLAFIKSIALGKGIENRSPLLDGAVLSIDKDRNESYSIRGERIEENFEESHRINAATLFYQLDSSDIEINELINHWEKNAKEESHRRMVTELKKLKNEI